MKLMSVVNLWLVLSVQWDPTGAADAGCLDLGGPQHVLLPLVLQLHLQTVLILAQMED